MCRRPERRERTSLVRSYERIALGIAGEEIFFDIEKSSSPAISARNFTILVACGGVSRESPRKILIGSDNAFDNTRENASVGEKAFLFLSFTDDARTRRRARDGIHTNVSVNCINLYLTSEEKKH